MPGTLYLELLEGKSLLSYLQKQYLTLHFTPLRRNLWASPRDPPGHTHTHQSVPSPLKVSEKVGLCCKLSHGKHEPDPHQPARVPSERRQHTSKPTDARSQMLVSSRKGRNEQRGYN